MVRYVIKRRFNYYLQSHTKVYRYDRVWHYQTWWGERKDAWIISGRSKAVALQRQVGGRLVRLRPKTN